mmetsp:Transcript_4338/g.6812  ORF Transcript_4338/g.6812 Transcript_4338/m.6812 type:complete len:222 (+) Transcript_4338:30-695(+)
MSSPDPITIPASAAMDPTPLINAYLSGPEDMPPPPEEPEEEPKLVKPENIRSRFWVHFMKYDLEFHPDKKNTARCSLCGKDISVKQGTGGLKNHLKFKHPEENSVLLDNPLQPSCIKMEQGSPSRGGTVAYISKKKPRHENAYESVSMRLDAEKRINEKHWMEMWACTRREMRVLRQELKEEDNVDAIEELEGDILVLKKRKSDYAEMLGYPKDDMVTEEA